MSESSPKIGFIAGCFDPFPHPGQIWAMKQAVDAGVCEKIVVGLHVDPSIERATKSRMYCSVEERTLMLEALRWTERVIPYVTEGDLVAMLREVNPDVRILGDDYKDRDDFTGSELGLPLFFSERKDGWSGTDFRRRIREDEFVPQPEVAG